VVVTGSRVATLRNLGDQRALVGSTTTSEYDPYVIYRPCRNRRGPLADGRGLSCSTSHDKDQGLRLPTQPLKHDNSLMRVRAAAPATPRAATH
jgi:hypothetical protein